MQSARFTYETGARWDGGGCERVRAWRHRQESNLHLRLRRSLFYPLNYGGSAADSGTRAAAEPASPRRQIQIRSSELLSPDWARSVKRWAMR
jgi:hypothetical protein